MGRRSDEPPIADDGSGFGDGEVRLADDPARLGERLFQEPPESPVTRLVEGDSGQRVLRSINPVRNQPACQECHGPVAERPVNGVLYVDYDADPTTEVLARWLYLQIAERLAADGTVRTPSGASYEIPKGLALERVRVWETSSSWGEYVGIE